MIHWVLIALVQVGDGKPEEWREPIKTETKAECEAWKPRLGVSGGQLIGSYCKKEKSKPAGSAHHAKQ